jgi:cell division protein FtsI (penicillin-binding protein 3)
MATRLGDVLRHLPIRLSFDGTAKQSIEVARHRLVIGGVLFALAFGVVGLRLVDLTLMKDGQEPRLAHLAKSGALEMERADIVDRNGVLLATSLATASLYANPKLVLDADDAAAKLARLLPGLPEAELRKNLSGERSFVWVRRNLTPRQQYEVNRLGLPGFFFRREERRVYPQSAMVGHSVGFTDIDNRGLAGVEQSLDERLRQSSEPVQLSIDLRAQYIVREELAATIAEFKAIGGAAIVMDVGTGQLLAMASLPDFDPNSPGTADPDARFNRATLGVYEMGSTFKIFTAAMALDFGTMTMRDGYDATKPIQVSRFTITDYHAQKRWLSLPEIMVYSSNIGAVKMALDVGRERQREFLGRLGLLKASPVELPDVGTPMLPNPWREINTMTIAFGHGISVSPLQLITGVSAVVNGGIMRAPTIIKRAEGEDAPGERVMAQTTSTQLRQLMRLVVEKGTGKGANVPGYDVGGKTGTSDKNVNGRYKKDSRISSFVGAFPMSAPRYAVLVMVDEPKGTKATFGYATAGWVAAPAAGRIVSRIAALYGVPPADGTITADARDKLAQNASVRR